MPNCKFCGKEIVWMKEGRKNIPVELDGIKHECEEFKRTVKSVKTLAPSDISAEDIARLEALANKKK